MKRITLLLVSLFTLSSISFAQGEMKKRQSPAETATGTINKTEITINYSSPRAKDRKIYGELVPFGKIWRAGANEATTITFSKDVQVEGKTLAAGTYALFVIPKQDGTWTVIFNKEAKQWGAYKHDESKDALRIEAKTSAIDHVENMTFVVDSKGMIHLDWSKTRMSFSVQ